MDWMEEESSLILEENLVNNEESIDQLLHISSTNYSLEVQDSLTAALSNLFEEFDNLSFEPNPFIQSSSSINSQGLLFNIRKELEGKTGKELSKICKDFKLAISGTKEEKIQRIIQYQICDLEWSNPPSNFQFAPKHINLPHSDPVGILQLESPFEVFSKFFTPLLINDFCEELSVNIFNNPRRDKGKPLVVKPYILYGYFALTLESSFSHCKNIRNYHTTSSYFQDIKFSQNKWLTLVSSLWRLSDDFIALMEITLNSTFAHYFIPDRNITIDESLRRFKGWWRSKVYSPDKPAKFGLKYYCLVDRNGYCLWFKQHRIKKEDIAVFEEKGKIFSICKEAIDHLYSYYPTISFNLFTDNYYGSLSLAKYLLEKGWDFTLGLRSNRVETSVVLAKMKNSISGDEKFSCRVNNDNKIALGAWKDKK